MWCLTAVVISAGSSCGSREERLDSTHSSFTAGTEPPRYDCTTCTSTTVVRGGGGEAGGRGVEERRRLEIREGKQKRGQCRRGEGRQKENGEEEESET